MANMDFIRTLFGLRDIKVFVRSRNENTLPFSVYIGEHDTVEDVIELIKKKQQRKNQLGYGVWCSKIFAPVACFSVGVPDRNVNISLAGGDILKEVISAANSNGNFNSRSNPLMFIETCKIVPVVYVQSIDADALTTAVHCVAETTAVSELVRAVYMHQAELRFNGVYGSPISNIVLLDAQMRPTDVQNDALVSRILNFRPNSLQAPLRYRGSASATVTVCPREPHRRHHSIQRVSSLPFAGVKEEAVADVAEGANV